MAKKRVRMSRGVSIVKQERFMKTFTLTAVALMLVSGVTGAYAADTMAGPKDTMAKPAMSDGMAKDSMAKPMAKKKMAMKADGMKHDSMKGGAMKPDAMKSDSMAH